jgi:hypothetical protein
MRVTSPLKLAVLGLLAIIFAGLYGLAAPALAASNDSFANAIVLSGAGNITGNNVGATGEPSEYVGSFPFGSGAPLNSLWYSWTAPANGVVQIGTCNPAGSTLTDYDTTIVVGTGATVSTFSAIVQNDDTTGCSSVVNPAFASQVTFNAVSGTTYMIQVDGYQGATGNFQLFYGFSGFTSQVTTGTATEGGATGAFTVVLNAVPSGTTTITVGSSPQCTFSPSTLTFTPSNWNTAQTVTVTANDDTVMEGTHFCNPASLTPSGGNVQPSSQPLPSFTITDNDRTVNIANTTNGQEAGPVNGVMTVTQGGTLLVANTISYTVAGTAMAGTDYSALSGSVTIPAGSTSATINIPVIDDLLAEGNETVIVTLTGASSSLAVLGTTTATNNTGDNEAPAVSIAATTNGVEGGSNGLMTLSMTQASVSATTVTYTVSGTATSGTDFTALSGSVTIAAGATTATIPITITNDTIVENLENITVTLTGVTAGTASLAAANVATITITDNDTATVTIATNTNGAEATPTNGVARVTQTLASSVATIIAYTVTGTATSGADYTALSGTVTIPAGSTTANITIPVINDTIVEGNETVIITLTSVTSGLATLGATLSATNTITDNDAATVSIAATTAGSESGPTSAVFTATQTNPASTNTVINIAFSGTATAATDYTSPGTTVTIPAGSTTATVTVPVINDAAVEGDETLILTLSSISSGQATLGAPVSATGTIYDDDAPTVTIANTTNGSEAGPANGVMTLTLSQIRPSNVVVAYTVSGTATSGSDYTALSGTITIPANTLTSTLSIPVLDDTVVEPGETVIVTLTSVTSGAASVGSPSVATNTIADNDSATVGIANTTNGAEATPTSGVMTLTLSAAASIDTVVNYTVSGSATPTADYTALSGTATITAGSTTTTLTFPVNNDLIAEGNETVIVTLNSITTIANITLGATVTATNTIADNDNATVTIANTTNGAEAGPVNGVLTVTQTLVSGVDTVIAYTVGGTATSGTDYTALSGSVTIPAGSATATITIPVITDAVAEGNETVIITLTSITSGANTALGATLTATNIIADSNNPILSIAATTNGNETGPVSVVFTVTQSTTSASNTVVNLTRAGTATVTNDYTAPGTTVTIPAGSTSATITYPVVNDATVEGDETLIVTMSTMASGLAVLGPTTSATATIFDNDSPTVTIANTANGAEAGPTNGTMTLTLSQAVATNVSVAYTVSGTASSGSDYTALAGTISFPATSTTATLTIPVLDDAIVENTETVIVTLTSVTSGAATLGATVTATNTISDNDSATVNIVNTTNGAEAGPANGLMTLTQSAVSVVNTVIAYTVGGTSTSGSDYTALSGTVTIAAGSTTATISIPVLDDAIFEGGETVKVTLGSITSGLNTSLGATVVAVNTITDNEVASPSLQLTKTASTPGPVVVGQVYTYSFAVKNTGNVPIDAVSVADTAFTGTNVLPVPGSEALSSDVAPLGDSTDVTSNNNSWSTLAPGDTVTFTASYTVSQADIDNQ